MSKPGDWQRVSVLLPEFDDVETAEAEIIARVRAGHVFYGSPAMREWPGIPVVPSELGRVT